MRSIQPIPTQRVPIVHAPSHTVFPVQRSERVIKDPQTGRSVSYDSYSISPEALRSARADADTKDLAYCNTCEHIHARGECPIEFRSDWNPHVDPDLGRALMRTVLGLIVIAAVVAIVQAF